MPYYYGTPATSVRLYDSSRSEYIDLTHDLTRLESAARDVIREASDFLYVGFERRFDAIMLWLGQTGVYTGLKWEISAADDEWVEFIPIQQREYKFASEIDYVRWDVNHPLFDAWRPTSLGTTVEFEAAPSGGTTATGTAVINNAGEVMDVTITDGGSGYDGMNIPDVTIHSSVGSGATGTVVLDTDEVDSVAIDTGGSGYYSETDTARYWIRVSTSDSVIVTIGGDVTTAIDLVPIISSGEIVEIIINDGGTGYTTETPLVVDPNRGMVRLEVDSVDNMGAITRVNVLDGGNSYTSEDIISVYVVGERKSFEGIRLSDTSVEFTDTTTTKIITVTAMPMAIDTIVDSVQRIDITDAGSGYDAATTTVTFSGGGGTGAAGTVEINNAGEVTGADITTAGSDYTSAPTVTITDTGSGSGATAAAYISMPVKLRHTANGGGYEDVTIDVDLYINDDGVPGSMFLPDLKMDDTRHIIVDPTALRVDVGNTGTYELEISYAPVGARQRATIKALSVRPYAYAASPKDVREQLQLEDDYDDETTPTDHTIERYLRGAEDGIYHITYHYFRPEFVEDERLNFEAYGMALRHQPILDILDLSVFNGNAYETKIEGRNRDWHYEPHTGMIHISTLFLDVIPPILRRGYSERRNQGAYKRAVRVRYIHGHDANTDPHSVEVGRIVTKQACIDIVSSQDFQRLLPQGLDRVTLQEKIRFWKEEVDAFTDRYAKLRLY